MTDQKITNSRPMPTQEEYDAGMARWQDADNAARARSAAPPATPSAPAVVPTPAPAAQPQPALVSPVASRQAEIDDMVGKLAAAGANVSNPVDGRAHASIQYNSATDEVQVLAAAAPGSENQPLADSDGLDLQGQIDRQASELQALQARLSDGRYDEITGQFKPTITGDTRERLERQLAQGKQSYEYSFNRMNQIAAQRVAQTQSLDRTNYTTNSKGEEVSWAEAAAKAAFVDSAPIGQRVAYGERWDRERIEARSRAMFDALKGK